MSRQNVTEWVFGNGWNCECDVRLEDKFMIVHVDFINDKKIEDEVSFDVEKFDLEELSDLFATFCKKNGFANDTVTCVSIVASAKTMEELQEIEL